LKENLREIQREYAQSLWLLVQQREEYRVQVLCREEYHANQSSYSGNVAHPIAGEYKQNSFFSCSSSSSVF
jgi:hypothetical protein